jgi:hypothetical protein
MDGSLLPGMAWQVPVPVPAKNTEHSIRCPFSGLAISCQVFSVASHIAP